MSLFVTHLDFLTRHSPALVYGVIYIATVFLGNISAFINFWFAFQINEALWRIVVLFFVVLIAETTGDCMWYAGGRLLRKTRFGNWVKDHLPGHGKAENALQNKGKRLIFLSKFAYGSAGPIAFSLGWAQMEFRVFVKNSFMAIAITLPLVVALVYGLFSGLSPLLAVNAFKHIEIVFLIGFIVFMILDFIVMKAIKMFVEWRLEE